MNEPRKTLGRGLGDLMSEVARIETPLATASDRGFLQLPVESVIDSAAAPAVPAEALLESIRKHGILQPILTRKGETGYELIDGRQRLAAARTLGLKAIPSLILNKPQAGLDVLAAEANRRAVAPLVAAPAPVSAPLPVNEPRPMPGGWRTDWRLPAAFAAIAVIALLAGMGAMRASHAEALTAVTGQDPSAPEVAHEPAAPASEADVSLPENGSAAGPAPVPAARVPPAWVDTLKIEGADATVVDDKVIITFNEPIFARYATLAPQAADVLHEVSRALAQVEPPPAIAVRGHTDDTPIRSASAWRDNYALGLARAACVVQYLRYEANLTNAVLSAVSFGDANPPFPNDSHANRRSNRTVTLEITTPTIRTGYY